VVCALLASGAAVNQVDTIGRTALHHCCVTAGGKDVADALMEAGAKRDLLDEEQNTPLHLACKTGNHPAVNSLLKYKVGESAPSPAFRSPLLPNSHPNSPGSSSYAIGGHHTAQ
jgi:ankyrin repeat protein